MGDLDVHVLMGNFDGRSVFTWRSFAIANIDTTGGRERRTGPIYAYGAGIEERTITSVLNPFNLLIWLLVLGCSVAVAICLVLAMLVYRSAGPSANDLVSPTASVVGITFKTLSSLIEPEGIAYFQPWSAGM